MTQDNLTLLNTLLLRQEILEDEYKRAVEEYTQIFVLNENIAKLKADIRAVNKQIDELKKELGVEDDKSI